MAKKAEAEKVAEEVVEEDRHPLLGSLRRVLLASIGVVALAQDELEEFVGKLVERGEIAEKDAKKLVQDLREKRKKETAKAEEELGKRVEEILRRMDIPTKSDIQSLSAKITELTDKVDELKEA
jgi:poly(hydroxyalkanoate) granule-associated protein